MINLDTGLAPPTLLRHQLHQFGILDSPTMTSHVRVGSEDPIPFYPLRHGNDIHNMLGWTVEKEKVGQEGEKV
jgi:hypothetical protein